MKVLVHERHGAKVSLSESELIRDLANGWKLQESSEKKEKKQLPVKLEKVLNKKSRKKDKVVEIPELSEGE